MALDSKLANTRILHILLGSFGLALIYGLKVNFTMGIYTLRSHNSDNNETSVLLTNSTQGWNFTKIEVINKCLLESYLRIFFLSYILCHVSGVRVCTTCSVKWVMFTMVFLDTLCSIATLLLTGTKCMLYIRLVEGLVSTLSISAMHVLLERWTINEENDCLTGLIYFGAAFGSLISILYNAYATSPMAMGILFATKINLCLIWLTVWAAFATDAPKEPIINDGGTNNKSIRIKSVLILTVRSNQKNVTISQQRKPYHFCITSVLINLICVFANGWAWYKLIMDYPLNIDYSYKYSINQMGYQTVMSYFIMWIFTVFIRHFVDDMRTEKLITVMEARRLTIFLCTFMAGIGYWTVSFLDSFMGVFISGALVYGVLYLFKALAKRIHITRKLSTLPGVFLATFSAYGIMHLLSVYSYAVIFWVTIVFYTIELIIISKFKTDGERRWKKWVINVNGVARYAHTRQQGDNSMEGRINPGESVSIIYEK